MKTWQIQRKVKLNGLARAHGCGIRFDIRNNQLRSGSADTITRLARKPLPIDHQFGKPGRNQYSEYNRLRTIDRSNRVDQPIAGRLDLVQPFHDTQPVWIEVSGLRSDQINAQSAVLMPDHARSKALIAPRTFSLSQKPRGGGSEKISGKAVTFEESYKFTFLTWRPVIDRQLGREVSVVVQGGSASWQIEWQRRLCM